MRQLKAAIIVNVAPYSILRCNLEVIGLDVHRHVAQLCVNRFQVEIEHSLT